jgi:hypothetical protein
VTEMSQPTGTLTPMTKTEYPKIDPVFKARWLEALRSGRYKRGKGVLRRETPKGSEFCCLGVACDLTDPDRWRDEGFYSGSQGWGEFDSGDTYGLPFMPVESLDDNYSEDDAACILLPLMNDGNAARGFKRSRSFKEIANWIEKNL